MYSYLLLAYVLVSLNHLLLYWGEGKLVYRDMFTLILSPFTMPPLLLVAVFGRFVDLEAVWIRSRR